MNRRVLPIPIGLIDIPARLRKVDPDYANAIGASIAQRGQDTPIWVFPATPDGRHVLITGAHRAAGCQQSGIPHIEALVFEGSPDEARLLEIDENLMRRELSALDRATFLALRQQVWWQLHPDTRRGKAGGKARQQQRTHVSFAEDVAGKLGQSARDVRRAIKRHDGVAADVRDVIALSWLADAARELDALAKLPPDEQRRVVDLLLDDDPKRPGSVAAATKAVRGVVEPPVNPDEAAHRTLLAAWTKATARARRSFVAFLQKQGALDGFLSEKPALKKARAA